MIKKKERKQEKMEEIKYEYVKTPLDYQITEYDCGTTTLLNALRYLFKRKEISPEVYKFIMQYTLDSTNEKGENCKGGTSIYALEFLANWLNDNAKSKQMPLMCEVLKHEEVAINSEKLKEHMNQGGIAILRVWQDCEHYVLLTKLDEEYGYVFDPYYLDIHQYDGDPDCEIIKDRPFEYNRKIKRSRFEEEGTKDFTFVKGKNQEMILIKKV